MICCAPAASTSRARSIVRMPPPTRHDRRPAICRTSDEVVARAHRRVEVDDLHLRETLEPPHPLEHVVVLDGEPLALNELDDRAALEIDRGNQHRAISGACEPRRHEEPEGTGSVSDKTPSCPS